MPNTVTISTHNGSSVAREHNIRNPKVVTKEDHIDITLPHEVWIDEPARKAYIRIFGEALSKYNEKQKRDDRKITDYYQHICDDKKKHPVYEMIIGIYGKNEDGSPVCDPAVGKEILRKFVDEWQNRNPNLILIGAYYHADEPNAEPHIHIDYVPVAHGFKRGLSIQSALVKALEEQGFYTESSKNTAQIQWERRENAYLTELCEQKNLTVVHPQTGEVHRDTPEYKQLTDLNEQIERNNKILNAPTAIPTGIEPSLPWEKKKGKIYPPEEISKCFEMRRSCEIKEAELQQREAECDRREEEQQKIDSRTKKKINDAAHQADEIITTAKKQARQIVADAQLQAKSIVDTAQSDADTTIKQATERARAADDRRHKSEQAASEWSEVLQKAKSDISSIKEREQRADVQELNRIIKMKDSTISSLRTDLEQNEEQFSELRGKIEKQELINNGQSQKISSLQADLDDQKRQFERERAEKERLQKKINEAELKIKEKDEKLSEYADYNEIKAENEHQKVKIIDLQAELTKLKDIVKKAFGYLVSATKAIGTLAYGNNRLSDLPQYAKTLIDAISNYTADRCKYNGYDDLAKDAQDRIGISEGIQQYIDKIDPPQRSSYSHEER